MRTSKAPFKLRAPRAGYLGRWRGQGAEQFHFSLGGLAERIKAKGQAEKALMGVQAKGLWDANRGGLHDTLGKRWFFRNCSGEP